MNTTKKSTRTRRLDQLLADRQFDLADPPNENAWIRFLIYGDLGSGKSYSIRTLPPEMRPSLVLDFDGKALGHVRGAFPKGQVTGIALPQDYTGFELAAYQLEKAQSPKGFPFRSVVIDTGTRLYDSIFQWVVDQQGLDLTSSDSSGKGPGNDPTNLKFDFRPYYHRAHRLFEEFLSTLMTLPCHLVFFYHENLDRNEEGVVVRAGPSLIGQLRERIPGKFGEVYHTRVVRNSQDPKKSQYTWITHHRGHYPARTEIPGILPEMPQNFGKVFQIRKGKSK